MSEETINIEEEFETSENGQSKSQWEEKIQVSGDELIGKVQELIKEATVRKITVKDENDKTLLSIPLWSGIFGVFFIGPWSALALIAAWAANLSILIEYEDLSDIVEDLSGDAVDDLTAIKGVGLKKAELLEAAGITSFAGLAALSTEELMEIARVNEATAAGWIATAQELS